MNHRLANIIASCLLAIVIPSAWAEAPVAVSLKAADGQVLKADWVRSAKPAARAVLLLHMMGGNRAGWAPLVPRLTAAGFNVLAVDQRGFGETSGERNWLLAATDAVAWMQWLRQQAGIDAAQVAVAGASIGGSTALLACALDSQCATVVSLSAPANFAGILPAGKTLPALLDSYDGRSAMLAAGLLDSNFANAARDYSRQLKGEVMLHVYDTGAHGTVMLSHEDTPGLGDEILRWLDSHVGPSHAD